MIRLNKYQLIDMNRAAVLPHIPGLLSLINIGKPVFNVETIVSFYCEMDKGYSCELKNKQE